MSRSMSSCALRLLFPLCYSAERPSEIKTGNVELTAVSSLGRLNNADSGWLWDYQTKTWHVKVNFMDSLEMTTKFFLVTAAESVQ